MDGAIDWHALPVVAEILGITDIDVFLARLLAVRRTTRRIHGAAAAGR
jgi:hypothetical protein